MSAFIKSGFVLMALLTLAGCSGGMSDLEEYVAEVKNRKSAQIEPIPQIKPYEAFAYEVGTRRDPFIAVEPQRDPAQPGSVAGPQPDLKRNKEPLEEFPLDGLRMQGTITFGKVTYALVKAPDGVVYRVSVGNHLGQNFGEIKKISDAEILISEIIPDGFGGFMARPASLALAE